MGVRAASPTHRRLGSQGKPAELNGGGDVSSSQPTEEEEVPKKGPSVCLSPQEVLALLLVASLRLIGADGFGPQLNERAVT